MNPQTRSILKSFLFYVVFIALLMLCGSFKSMFPAKSERLVYGLIGTFVALTTTWIFLKFDKKTFRHIGLYFDSQTLKKFGLGISIGLIAAFLMIFSLIYFAELKVEFTQGYYIPAFLLSTLPLIPLAFMEEVAFRAYPFAELRKATGLRIAQVIIALMFAYYHVAGDQLTTSVLLGPGVWSFVFGMAAVMSGGIALPTGLHYAANLVLAAFGQKKEFESIWTIEYKNGTSAPNTEVLGNVVQIVLFVLTIILMEFYLRKKNKQI